ncbi:M50 family metallopeptidase [Knoellia aerolata]|uniref:Membrane protein n=1 Tax=Knoellia aerolata DSM 18566 TaxID=1385519 RepID=A0A0A0JSZ3_9MICO|nr:M50 family metallopeptidase [Knoellia aerolata]KGN40293.1 membrane protein [Knoellia aerolata DSM 18566]
MDVPAELTARLGAATPGLAAGALVLAVLVALLVALAPALWLRLRIAVTLVHELGHAVVGVLSGRRFTGFVVRGDMSGHAVTVGPARGVGRVATTWAGYPVPPLVGLLMLYAVSTGYAATLLFACLLTLAVVLVFVRSAGTLFAVLAAGAGIGALWWWRDNEVQALVVAATGLVLIVGGWRHLGAVASAGRRDPGSDAVVLSRLTGIPAWGWIATFGAVHAGATWGAALLLLDLT